MRIAGIALLIGISTLIVAIFRWLNFLIVKSKCKIAKATVEDIIIAQNGDLLSKICFTTTKGESITFVKNNNYSINDNINILYNEKENLAFSYDYSKLMIKKLFSFALKNFIVFFAYMVFYVIVNSFFSLSIKLLNNISALLIFAFFIYLFISIRLDGKKEKQNKKAENVSTINSSINEELYSVVITKNEIEKYDNDFTKTWKCMGCGKDVTIFKDRCDCGYKREKS